MSGFALVTGAGRGVGRAVAVALARRGVDLALVGRPSPQHAEAVSLLEQLSGKQPLEAFADFQDAAALELAARTIVAQWGAPSIVVHNAGVVVRARIEDTSIAAW